MDQRIYPPDYPLVYTGDGTLHMDPAPDITPVITIGEPETGPFYDPGYAPLDTDAPPADEWSDVPLDYRQEVYGELPDVTDDGPIDLDRLAAEKLLKRYHRLSIEEREAVQFVDDEIARLDEQREALIARRAEILKPIERKRAWLDQFRGLLESWARAALSGKRERSIKLTYGAVAFRKRPASLNITDPNAALCWAKEHHPAAVQEAVIKSEIRGYIVHSGEVPAGCEWNEGEDTFSLEVAG